MAVIEIDVNWDPEANVYIGVGKNISGLVVEAETLDKLKEEIDLLLQKGFLIRLNFSYFVQ